MQRQSVEEAGEASKLSTYGIRLGQGSKDSLFTNKMKKVKNLGNMAEALQITSMYPNVIGAVVSAKAITYLFVIPITSGVVGGGMGKYIPVGALQSDLRLELGIASWAHALRPIIFIIL